MGKFNHFRYVIAVLLAVGLFIVINIEKHLPMTLVDLFPGYVSKGENTFQLLSLGRGIQALQFTTYISMILSANLILKWDSKLMLAIGIGGMSFCHVLIPPILPFSRALFIIVCILQGLFHGMIFPYFLTVMSFWTPIMENTTLLSIPLFGYWLGLGLCEPIFFHLTPTNLDVSFYVFGALGVCWTVLWLILAKGKPSDDPKITQTELKHILSNGNEGGITTLTSYIRKRIFITRSTISHFAVIFCNGLNFTIAVLMVNTIGLEKMLDYTILYSYLVAPIAIVAIALTSDYFRQKYCITKIRKTVICTGLLCSAILIPLTGIYYPQNSTSYSALFGSFLVFQTIILTSYFVNLLDVMHHAAGHALGVFLGLTGLIAAVLAVCVTNNNANVICWVVTAFNIVGCLLYTIWGSAKRESWAMNQAETTTETSVALNETRNEPVTHCNV